MTRITALFLASIALMAIGGALGLFTSHAATGVIVAYVGLVLQVSAQLHRRS